MEETQSTTTRPDKIPLCVDLDGTLVCTDLLIESFLVLIKRNPLYLALIPFWLLRGRAALKAEICSRAFPPAESLPYNAGLVRWLESERSTGRKIYLCTAANGAIAERIARHLQLFDGVIASTDRLNLVGPAKGAELAKRFGQGAFDYCGNEWVDLAVWKHARGAIAVRCSEHLEQAASRLTPIVRSFRRDASFTALIGQAIRPQYWIKNFLVLIPLFVAHRANEPALLAIGLLAVLAFCLCASSAYVVNDLLDLEADRADARKARRPLAAGDLSLMAGFALAAVLLLAAVLVSLLLPFGFQAALTCYLVLSLSYSFFLKGVALVDVVALAGLYMTRIVAGAFAVSASLSPTLLLVSSLLFLSLAFAKKHAELARLRSLQLH
jgi:hypothetical protein